MSDGGKILVAVMLAAAVQGCASTGGGTGAGGITDQEWALTSLAGKPVEVSNPLRPLTLRIDSDVVRAGGFAGCNRFSAGYELSGDQLRFGAAIATRMACVGGMELERDYLQALSRVTRYRLQGSTLTLLADKDVLATYQRL
ncbi:META domain-containing protein [Perlucidibaca piscinae]|uniref:META domain-containing protein n=1 Tax=Perlucidibaca piscinae TaxID=392589 RepID=UPI0003B58C06|nr:META domain-containing protein [Perlucidibaca piscinae]